MPLNQADGSSRTWSARTGSRRAEACEAKPARAARLFRRKRAPVPFTAQPTAAKRDRRSDLTVAALGITLGLICALFPWYIFFNPDEFGVRAMKFGGNGGEHERPDHARSAAAAHRRADARRGNPADEARPVRDRHGAQGRGRRGRARHARARPNSPSPRAGRRSGWSTSPTAAP